MEEKQTRKWPRAELGLFSIANLQMATADEPL